MRVKSAEFYNKQYGKQQYSAYKTAEEHYVFKALNAFISDYNLSGMKCLEVGGGRGLFQDCVHDYVAIDIANTVKGFFRKPFCQASAKALPFQNNSFDVVWSLFTLEHVFDPEPTIVEMRRVLRNKGYFQIYTAEEFIAAITHHISEKSFAVFSFFQIERLLAMYCCINNIIWIGIFR